jgi:uncharacterized coiled-coil DUF342 family protein
MNDREQRLRERIDTVTGQRDTALEALEACRKDRKKLRSRISDLTRSRELWRTRATRNG